MLHKNKFFHHLISDEMLLDNAFDDLWAGGPIPNAFRVNQQNGTFDADSKTVGLGAKDAGGPIAAGLIELEFD